MKEKLTITISPGNKKFLKQYALRQNKSMSQLIDDLISAMKAGKSFDNNKNRKLSKTADAYDSKKELILSEVFKSLTKDK